MDRTGDKEEPAAEGVSGRLMGPTAEGVGQPGNGLQYRRSGGPRVKGPMNLDSSRGCRRLRASSAVLPRMVRRMVRNWSCQAGSRAVACPS